MRLHLATVRKMLKWLFAYDMIYYARYLLVSSIACNQAIELTINCDAKTKDGITEIKMNQQAVLRWILPQSERCAITRQCKDLAGINHEVRISKDLDDQNHKWAQVR